jgi:hypothetical protein
MECQELLVWTTSTSTNRYFAHESQALRPILGLTKSAQAQETRVNVELVTEPVRRDIVVARLVGVDKEKYTVLLLIVR